MMALSLTSTSRRCRAARAETADEARGYVEP
jgi:hypothetical protein